LLSRPPASQKIPLEATTSRGIFHRDGSERIVNMEVGAIVRKKVGKRGGFGGERGEKRCFFAEKQSSILAVSKK